MFVIVLFKNSLVIESFTARLTVINKLLEMHPIYVGLNARHSRSVVVAKRTVKISSVMLLRMHRKFVGFRKNLQATLTIELSDMIIAEMPPNFFFLLKLSRTQITNVQLQSFVEFEIFHGLSSGGFLSNVHLFVRLQQFPGTELNQAFFASPRHVRSGFSPSFLCWFLRII